MYDIDKIRDDLKNNLSEFRYEHSIMVADDAKALARHYHLDEDKAYIAGLVHDIAKEFSWDENKECINKYSLSKELLDSKFENIVHADIGACVAYELYGLDGDVCEAIRYHTIGNKAMTLFDKIIFISDKIGRKKINREIEIVKELAYQNIDEALEYFLISQRDYLASRGKEMHHDTLELLKSISSNIN